MALIPELDLMDAPWYAIRTPVQSTPKMSMLLSSALMYGADFGDGHQVGLLLKLGENPHIKLYGSSNDALWLTKRKRAKEKSKFFDDVCSQTEALLEEAVKPADEPDSSAS